MNKLFDDVNVGMSLNRNSLIILYLYAIVLICYFHNGMFCLAVSIIWNFLKMAQSVQ